MHQHGPFRFDFAISYAGEQREVARAIYDGLNAKFSVFYDRDNIQNLFGLDGELELTRIYSAESRFYIVLVSPEYELSRWTQLELSAIQSRAAVENEAVLLPVLVEAYQPKCLSPAQLYFNLQELGQATLIETLCEKANDARNDSGLNSLNCDRSACFVWISSAEIYSQDYANLVEEMKAHLGGLGFPVGPSDGPRNRQLCPVIECKRVDRLLGLHVKAVVDSLIRRRGPFDGEVEGDAQLKIVDEVSLEQITVYV